MTNDVEGKLERWGSAQTPPVDGAFANQLEGTLRQQMVEDEPTRSTITGWLLRPGSLALAGVVLVVVIGMLTNSSEPDPLGVADDVATTVTTVSPEPPSTNAPATSSSVAPSNPPHIESTSTTTSVVASPTTTTSTVQSAPSPTIDMRVQRDQRVVTVDWSTTGDVTDVVGWVLIRSLDGADEVVETSREPRQRQFTSTITDLAQTFRVEGRAADGSVAIASSDIGVALAN